MKPRAALFALPAALFALLMLVSTAAGSAQITVFAAASLTNALQDIGQAYKSQNKGKVVFSFASSSVLAKQIEAGGSGELFISADSEWIDYLDERGLLRNAARKNLLGNRLVLIAPKDSKISLVIEPGFPLAKALGDGKLAIADPDLVPAGRYARSALTVLGVWNSIAEQVARAENVRMALAYVARGEAPLGIVYETDARIEPMVRIIGIFPEDTHPPIVYPLVLTKDAKPDARTFFDYLSGPEARAIFEKYGFTVLTKP